MASIYPRGKTWWIAYRLNGKTICEPLKTRDKGKAEKLKAKMELALERGEVVEEKHIDIRKFLLEEYRKRYLQAGGKGLAASREATWRKSHGSLQAFIAFADRRNVKRMDKVTVEFIEDYRAVRSGGGASDATVNKDLRSLKAGWNVAKRLGYVRENPFTLVRPIRIPARRITFLNAAAVKQLLERMRGERLFPLVAVAVYAGLRASELATLRWENVNLAEAFIGVRNVEGFVKKSRRERIIPIAPELAVILKPLKKEQGLCFPNMKGEAYRDSELDHRVRDMRTRAKLPFEFTLQVLRRTFATQLRARGVPIEAISAYLGHCSITVTQSWYADFDPSGTENYVDRLSFTPTAIPETVDDGQAQADQNPLRQAVVKV